ncbi:AAA domain-containing protein [Solitalea canadensis]|uniref:WGR domain-containing protein n=1 Tax=Solitalea canadensis (strain ATCC 29591 / DSM 3403 / JCM 21819 / LMG 8368 / NBRC 15130 / NCIMB 12057 / USAM 9D) TaxID=929556 RepID=H8KVC8_SOLCM|nr:AAA domain-containing protein [Solitalea canadensis]AFD06308.1 WGR domain-containing protein [Solitalea canadensis DSM 3403]
MQITFKEFLNTAFDQGNYTTDDVIAFLTPLMEEVLSFHEEKKVASFERERSLFINNNVLDIDENFAHPSVLAPDKINLLWQRLRSPHFAITGESKFDTDVDSGATKVEDLHIKWNSNEELTHPAYIAGYNSYEIISGHHDGLTDIFCLGLLLASISMGLNFYIEDDLRTFVQYRTNPIQYNNRIHPTVGALITQMTELDRAKRTQDLYNIINVLQNYRDYDFEKQTDLSNTAGWVNKELTERSQFILQKLRKRLFDTSRRNRLLYYKPNMRFVNLTISSVPKVLHYQSINPELLFTWNKEISGRIKGMKDIVLNKYLRFDDHLYLLSSLDKIRTESLKDVREFGFSQLKLVVAFLNWHNLKENPNERIQSPLLLLPVTLKRNKKLKEDLYVMSVEDNVAEVNPVLANLLKDLYDIKLPEFVDLDEMSPEEFYNSLKVQIDAAKQGIILNFIDKPRIKLIHSVARQTINNYAKRLRKNSNFSSYKDIDYSYNDENYKPLGLEIFRQRVEPTPSYLEFLINEDIELSSYNLTGDNDKHRTLYTLTESENNPYSWDVDVCNMVLGNFNYKKMSLVRDYTSIIDENIQHKVFDNLFSNEPKQYKDAEFDLNNPTDWYHVITADPTQTKAILQSRSGESYVIQGPPGTGKSQTITNLIADFVAHGKHVLFVCEKRAALDVVFARLKQKGLDELCCYIHDSQTDKRSFIKNLNATYEDFIKKRLDLKMVSTKRNVLLQQLSIEIDKLKVFHSSNAENYAEADLSVRELIGKVITLKPHLIPVSDQQDEMLPPYKYWNEFGEDIQQLSTALEEIDAEPQFADHPFSKINDDLFLWENTYSAIDQLIAHIKSAFEQINKVLKTNNIPVEFEGIKQLSGLIEEAVSLNLFADTDNLALVDNSSEKSKQFNEQIKLLNKEQQVYQQFQEKNENWINKFKSRDVEAALVIAEKNEGFFFSFLNGSWRSLKKQIQQSYDLTKHQVKPSYKQVLQLLQQEYQTAREIKRIKETIEDKYNLKNVEESFKELELLRSKHDNQLIIYLVETGNTELVKQLSRLNNTFHQLEINLRQCLANYENNNLSELHDDLDNIMANAHAIKDLLPALRTFSKLPYHIKLVLREIPLTPLQAQAVIAHKTLQMYYRSHRSFEKIDYHEINQTVIKIRKSYKQLLKLNADYIKASIRSNFLEHYELSNMAVSQLDQTQRQIKKNYSEGRKILENEFSKSMRFKSIRELSAKESGIVLKDIKPVWLMSPLSVSDSLPVDNTFFDVVIFDEASQITLEQGVPALYRSSQTIIVGDDKQMPPTNFFTAKAEDPDDLEKNVNDEDDELLSNEADSILVQGARKLHSTMLSWHYRSKFETLISYSNHAFYDAGLLTIPDKTIHHTEKRKLEVTKPEEATINADALFDRSMSFHHLSNSVYEKRGNIAEATYIANLVRELLKRKVNDSIGIVAFSQEQQHIIEDALTALAKTDKKFEQDLEDAYNRVEDEQHVGLFVKNLENVQGDERDIIIMSVCYGFDNKRKMLMNFGPVNKKGGEKRLNVIFSRAKKHMAIISSIKHSVITNDYNEGANYFKRFLHYAEAVSDGNMQLARTILNGLQINKHQENGLLKTDVIIQQLKAILQKRGYEVMENVGQSMFKCSLAIKANPNDTTYALGLLVDDDSHYENKNMLEQYFQRPEVLQACGWKIMPVYAKDWLNDHESVIESIIKKLSLAEEEQTEEEVDGFLIEEEVELPLLGKPSLGTPYDHLVFDRIVCINDQSNKFWEAAVDKNKLVVRFGKIGSKGQLQIKTYINTLEAEEAKLSMLMAKKSQGYTAE